MMRFKQDQCVGDSCTTPRYDWKTNSYDWRAGWAVDSLEYKQLRGQYKENKKH